MLSNQSYFDNPFVSNALGFLGNSGNQQSYMNPMIQQPIMRQQPPMGYPQMPQQNSFFPMANTTQLPLGNQMPMGQQGGLGGSSGIGMLFSSMLQMMLMSSLMKALGAQSSSSNNDTSDKDTSDKDNGNDYTLKNAFQEFLQELVGINPKEIQEGIDANKEAIKTNEQVDNHQQNQIDENKEAIKTNEQANEQQQGQIDQNAQNINTNSEQINTNAEQINTNAQNISQNNELDAQQQEQLNANAQIDAGQQAQLDENAQVINTLQDQIANLQEQLANLQEQLSANEAVDEQQQQDIAGNTATNAQQQAQINENTQDIAENAEGIYNNTQVNEHQQNAIEDNEVAANAANQLNAQQQAQINENSQKIAENKEDIEELQQNSATPTFRADGGYGLIDWNQDGDFRNDFVAGNEDSDWYENFLAVHGDTDRFFNHFGTAFRIPNLESIMNSDNTAEDTDSREGFVSDGTVTAHQIGENEIGFNITEHDSSKAAPFAYNYVIWNKEDNTYKVGFDKNGDENLTGNELKGIIENVGTNSKTSSPLILDINGDGEIGAKQGIGVDLDRNGAADGAAINGDKMLAMGDLNGNGVIDGAEVFGNETINPFTGEKLNAANGFEALEAIAKAAEARTGEEVIDAQGLVNVQALNQALNSQNINLGLISYGNVTQLETLANVGSIGTSFTNLTDTEGDELHLQEGSYITEDGEQRLVHDVWFKLS